MGTLWSRHRRLYCWEVYIEISLFMIISILWGLQILGAWGSVTSDKAVVGQEEISMGSNIVEIKLSPELFREHFLY